MKKLLFLSIILLSLASCKQKDYVTLEVQLSGLEPTDTVLAVYGRQYQKMINLNDKGVFKDTLKVNEAGYFGIVIGQKVQFQSFLRNGFDIVVKGDAKDFVKTAKFSGNGSVNTTYLQERIKELNAFNEGSKTLMEADSAVFLKGVNDFETKLTDLLSKTKKVDTLLVKYEKDGLKGYVSNLKETFNVNLATKLKFAKGRPSPKFVNFENYKGGKTSLDDLKGKFVYIDLWATWCEPCLKEIPALKDLEKEYRGKNITFVSISTDQKVDYNKWKTMVKDKELTGIQLYFGEDLEFVQAYNVSSIPRFILIDPNGNIVEQNAPRPSQKAEIVKLFTESGVK